MSSGNLAKKEKLPECRIFPETGSFMGEGGADYLLMIFLTCRPKEVSMSNRYIPGR